MHKFTTFLLRTTPKHRLTTRNIPSLLRFNVRPFSIKEEDTNTALFKYLNEGNMQKLQPKEDSEYHIDNRSGDDVSDDDADFASIVDIDQLLRGFTEGTFEEGELPKKIITLFSNLYKVREMIEFDSEILK